MLSKYKGAGRTRTAVRVYLQLLYLRSWRTAVRLMKPRQNGRSARRPAPLCGPGILNPIGFGYDNIFFICNENDHPSM